MEKGSKGEENILGEEIVKWYLGINCHIIICCEISPCGKTFSKISHLNFSLEHSFEYWREILRFPPGLIAEVNRDSPGNTTFLRKTIIPF